MYKSELMTAIQALCADLRKISGKEAVWKDADPRQWPQLSAQFTQHQSPLCQAAKSSASGMAICSQHCNHPRPAKDQACLKNCPFGVRELRIPVLVGTQYLGCLSIGPWQGRAAKKTSSSADYKKVQQLHKSLPAKDDYSAQAIKRLIIARLQQIALLYHPHGSSAATGAGTTNQGKQKQLDTRLDNCLSYIQEHLHLQLRAASVARIVNLSSSRFVHWFKEQTGSPYRQYLQHEVLKRCAQQLLHQQTRILDIALDAGYHSPSSFAAAFKQHYGIQPSAFKRQMMRLG